MRTLGTADIVLPADPRSVPEARRLVRDVLAEVGADHLTDRAGLAVSELVTNAVVHTGSDVRLRSVAARDSIRVEVSDGSSQHPTPRDFAATAGTGRGLLLVQGNVDRWGVATTETGKTVWFEIGHPTEDVDEPRAEEATTPRPADAATVRLLDVPLLMHWAWQEHAQSLLREYLLFALEDDPEVLEQHAQASAALSLLHAQIPAPELPDDPDELLADTLEPGVTARELTLEVPREQVAAFSVLDDLLARAADQAAQGRFLGPPTQPEISEMRQWFAEEVVEQAVEAREPRPWHARTDVRTPLAESERLLREYAELAGPGSSVLVTNEASVIVAVSDDVVRFLGYADPEDLLGRRIIVVVPERYHQAHIAGTTLNATNGRDKLLDVSLTVPMVRADGSEAPVQLAVSPRVLHDSRVFVAALAL